MDLPSAPLWYWIVAVLAVLWNLMGVAAFGYDASSNHHKRLERYGEPMANAMAAQPKWVWIAYSVAVFAGFIASIGLLLRVGWAPWVFMISLGAVLLQQANLWVISGIAKHMKGSEKGFSLMIVGVAVALLVFSFWVTSRGFLH